MLDDEEHLVVMDRMGERLLRFEKIIQLQIARIGEPVLQVQNDPRFQHSLVLRRLGRAGRRLVVSHAGGHETISRGVHATMSGFAATAT